MDSILTCLNANGHSRKDYSTISSMMVITDSTELIIHKTKAFIQLFVIGFILLINVLSVLESSFIDFSHRCLEISNTVIRVCSSGSRIFAIKSLASSEIVFFDTDRINLG
ncbi:hypothetical protein DERF_007007 [Dermatophagoides farinae]|uniref:Uncharacterized protein n=1 Tax=Dermatophagoides farinae TaxID=6954 RepID=A0A922L2M9_DERFA|nr:hypothetical protein DERF_007007 [Dermatophagoides farinae]